MAVSSSQYTVVQGTRNTTVGSNSHLCISALQPARSCMHVMCAGPRTEIVQPAHRHNPHFYYTTLLCIAIAHFHPATSCCANISRRALSVFTHTHTHTHTLPQKHTHTHAHGPSIIHGSTTRNLNTPSQHACATRLVLWGTRLYDAALHTWSSVFNTYHT